MTLRIHNTRTKHLDIFTPIAEGKVSLYTCGPTVYDFLHVGNWAAYIYWDTLVRTLLASGYEVERVMNITDVGHLVSDADDGQDKLEKGARREGKTAWEIAQFYADDFIKGMKKLNLLAPEHLVKATDYIPEQLELIRTLKQRGHTYQITDGIYFDTSTFKSYADFAGLDLKAQQAGARVEVNNEKRNPSDFALWKFSPASEKRDMEWETPSDLLDDTTNDHPMMGFPGWHLECSAMAMNILGSSIDIHTGGIDHIPVHHTNEIAQSEAASGQRFAQYWLHNNHLKVDGTKISKSLGNGYTLQNLEERGFSALDYRMAVLQGHYENEGNFTFENLEAAHNRREHWRAIAALRWQIAQNATSMLDEQLEEAKAKLLLALQDNLNTPEGLRLIDAVFSRPASDPMNAASRAALDSFLMTADNLLGLELTSSTPDINDDVKMLIADRETARQQKQWSESDRLRGILAERGIHVNDTANGTVWSYL